MRKPGTSAGFVKHFFLVGNGELETVSTLINALPSIGRNLQKKAFSI